MKILTKLTFTVGAMLLGSLSFAQNPMMNDQGQGTDTAGRQGFVNQNWKPTLIPDGIIDRVPHENALLPIHKIREIDIAWKVTVWRRIDIRQKQNMAFRYTGDAYSGGGAFIEILNHAVKSGQIQAYSNVDDRFTTPMDMSTFDKTLGIGTETQFVMDPETGKEVKKVIHNTFNVNSVTQYEVKEEWMFDRNRGRMIVQLVGIAPLKDEINPNTGAFISSIPMYWVYYPQLRETLSNYEVYNPLNDMHRMSWTDFLDGHYYESYVIKTSLNNPTQDQIANLNTLRALSEGKKAVNSIINKEMDMWQE